jgi:hypothetical protein
MQTPHFAQDRPAQDAGVARGSRRRRRFRYVSAVTVSAVFALAAPWQAHAGQPVDPPHVVSAAHFLGQATFGASAADIEAVRAAGFQQWLVDQAALPESQIPDGLDSNGVRAAVFKNMATGPDQVRQRAIFALSQIFVVSANKVGTGSELTPWVRLLSRNALGNYQTLLREVTLNPTMGKYLDLGYSKKAGKTTAPNENYPREMLQLFTIGLWALNQDGTLKLNSAGEPIPTYTQETIHEIARALTGWTFPRDADNNALYEGEMVAVASNHDTGTKQVHGLTLPANQTPAADLDAVVNAVFAHSNVPPFVATRLIRSLVTSNPSPGYIRRVADVFVNNGMGVRGDLKAVFAAILLDPEALRFQAAHEGRLKDPVLHVIGMGRALDATFQDPNGFMYVFNNLSQRVLTPPTVFSFFSPLAPLPGHHALFGPEFQIYPPALAIQRANFIYGLLNSQFGSSFQVDLTPFTTVAGNTAALVELVNQRLMFGSMSADLRGIITAATNGIEGTSASDLRQRALGALYLAAISSEYSVHGLNWGPSSGGGAGVDQPQPPTGLVASSMIGNRITLKWTPPTFGPAPTGYVIEGGVSPGETLATIPTGSAPTVTFDAPPGSFYLRVHTVAGAARSRSSSEIRVHVNAPTAPSVPANLLGLAHGSTVALAWRNTFSGGIPTSLVLDVAGSLDTSLPLPMGDSFTFNGVPDGTYTFSVRAVNAVGTSGPSSPVTLSFPATCTGAPQRPVGVVASRSGAVISLAWEPAASGAAPTSYVVNVTGAATVSVPTTARSVGGAVGPGTYTLRVVAVNACGSSAASSSTTVVIP